MLNILLADDSLPSVAAGQAMLEKMGHNVTVAHCGQEALDKALKQPFDLVILDEYMPGMDGSQVAQGIRRSKTPNTMVPIVSLSGAFSESRRLQMLDSGIDCCISKPICFAELSTLVSKYARPTTYRLDADVIRQMQSDLDAEVVDRLFGLFADELQALAARMAAALDHNDDKEVHAVVHILKNTAALYGAKELADLARQLDESPPADGKQFLVAGEKVLHVTKETWKCAKELSL
ncbi:response regulator [Spongiibacter sp. KMU-166]|uniref:Response regulator n=1 Tax=Spongiibacter thalassae TaxID=2721624 RepID=A0ABX1GLP8_9GAMM|nr:response regulator [Spongiibacter thalassae]NKI19357.1 response regulator [Spongiibacter thalassae]